MDEEATEELEDLPTAQGKFSFLPMPEGEDPALVIISPPVPISGVDVSRDFSDPSSIPPPEGESEAGLAALTVQDLVDPVGDLEDEVDQPGERVREFDEGSLPALLPILILICL
jgi:hypothetical protein